MIALRGQALEMKRGNRRSKQDRIKQKQLDELPKSEQEHDLG